MTLLLMPLFIISLHAVLARLFAHAPRQAVAAAAGVITALIFTAAFSSFYVFIIGMLYAHVYFHVFNMSETARRIRILVGWKLGRHSYSADDMVSVRLRRLRDLKEVVLRDGRYYSRPTILRGTAGLLDRYERLLFKRAATAPPTRS